MSWWGLSICIFLPSAVILALAHWLKVVESLKVTIAHPQSALKWDLSLGKWIVSMSVSSFPKYLLTKAASLLTLNPLGKHAIAMVLSSFFLMTSLALNGLPYNRKLAYPFRWEGFGKIKFNYVRMLSEMDETTIELKSFSLPIAFDVPLI